MAAVSSKSFEVNLQGEVSKNEYSAFEERIRGLCGNDTEKVHDAGPPRHGGVVHALCEINLELRHVGKWERKKPSEQTPQHTRGHFAVPYRSQTAMSASDNVGVFLTTLGFRYDYNMLDHHPAAHGRTSLTLRILSWWVLDKVESKDELPLDSVPFDAYLVEVYSVTTDDKIDDVSHQINRFAIDLEPYLVARPSEGKDFQIHKETLLAESKKKKQKLR
ncbi:hypothetical protein DYB25_009179 [Aphanomyces astaci]|uniref:Mediator of RNA polymerase II transcription subunit 18 n=1 Tax=Aphanomyces astaci TaxID=112090 RepID=A0A397F3K2_APHAT|nr:hypothetical protein DYB36_004360 [Aphanomyces astaci]RHY08122.1 hypothetical protein DYB25_009179 [Aphanomyces astaci]RHY38455.1 hypothetical protein DYB38_009692 [Aphanomyces astaci]RHY52840.1 hypothetical protein DYB34_009841 [Aphanomyces astaci]RHY73404.1 hypothetical protein DYB30_010201 [Aphanomyces astaci]